ncbi:MAG: methylenetetrahydrofolate reductase [NAD(P)H] [Gammaproteobacteria bacterium]
MDSQNQYRKTFSFEFFPPKTEEGAEKLRATRTRLGALNPRYFSVTFGAGGSTQQGTYDAVMDIERAGFEAAPHLSCIGATRETVRELLERYKQAGIRRIVALRGDMPSGMRGPAGAFAHANELVEFIRAETGRHFHIEVAAYPEFHPQARSAREDLLNFKRKAEAGADGAITQYFFNADAYYRFVDDCERLGLDLPIVPGIMPITNYSQLARFSDMCGAEIPRWLRKRLEGFGDDRASIRAYGADVVTDMCRRLLQEGAPGLHFYTMNQSAPTLEIWRRLKLG